MCTCMYVTMANEKCGHEFEKEEERLWLWRDKLKGEIV